MSPYGYWNRCAKKRALRNLLLIPFLLAGCATLPQPRPIGEPSPLACYGAKRTHDAWKELIEKYINDMMAAQVAYSCAPVPIPAPPLAPDSP